MEGSEDDIRATYYMLAFEREFLEDESELRWKVVDMMVIGGEARCAWPGLRSWRFDGRVSWMRIQDVR